MSDLTQLLEKFIFAPEDPEINLRLALYYDEIGQTASAISYYLRCAERVDEKISQYQCLLKAAFCFERQGCRNFTVRGLLQHAVSIMPDRPEGYFFLSRFLEREKNYHDGYLIASIGDQVAYEDLPPLSIPTEYPGFWGLKYEKAVCSWWTGLCDESREMFEDLLENHPIDFIHRESIIKNLKMLNSKKVGLHEVYHKNKARKHWENSIAPTMEFTTSIDVENGCVVDCVFCPQRTLQKVYKGERFLSMDNFKKTVDKLPTQVRVTFAGFTEPWLNPKATDMLLYADKEGHPISVFTTGIGMKLEDVDRIKDIQYAGNPNGGFVLHLPDQERKAKHPITKRYIEVIERFGEVHKDIHNFTLMCMGTVHESVRHVFPEAPTYQMWSRAGNLLGESIMKPELLNRKDEYKSVYHGDKEMTCGCLEKLYHNVMLPNGDVALCCMDYGLEHILGNLFEQPYDEIMPENNTCFNLCKFCENAVDP